MFVVFATGHVEKLSAALLASRKNPRPGFLSTEETITYVEIVKEARVVVMLAQKEVNLILEENLYFILVLFITFACCLDFIFPLISQDSDRLTCGFYLTLVIVSQDASLTLYTLSLGESVCQQQDSHTLALSNAHLTGICATSSAKLVTLCKCVTFPLIICPVRKFG